MGAIIAFEGVFWGKCGEDGGDSFGLESHVVVPFVVVLEGFDAVGRRMSGDEFEVSSPVWIDGPVGFEVATHPFEEGFSRITFWDFYGVVHTDEADSFVHELLDLVEMRNDRMASSAVGEDDDGLGVVEEFRIFRPEFGDFGFHGEP